MIRPSSFFELSTLKSKQAIRFLSKSTSQILKSSTGRDKILGFIQYSAELYKESMMDYLSSKRVREWPISVRNSKIIDDSMKTGRKLFRLFRWL